MKPLLFSLLAFAFLPSAHATDLGIGSLVSVECKSVFEGQETQRVRVASRRADGNGATLAMSLRVDRLIGNRWYQQIFNLDGMVLNEDATAITVLGRNRRNERLTLTIDLSDESIGTPDFYESEIKINGRSEDYLKFVCRSVIAG